MHHDHLQKLGRRLLEQRRHANFLLGLELAALHPRDRGVQAEGAVGEVQTVVEQHLVEVGRVAQVLLLERHGVGVQRLVALDLMARRIALLQVRLQALLVEQLLDLLEQGGGITLEVFQSGHVQRPMTSAQRVRQVEQGPAVYPKPPPFSAAIMPAARAPPGTARHSAETPPPARPGPSESLGRDHSPTRSDGPGWRHPRCPRPPSSA